MRAIQNHFRNHRAEANEVHSRPWACGEAVTAWIDDVNVALQAGDLGRSETCAEALLVNLERLLTLLKSCGREAIKISAAGPGVRATAIEDLKSATVRGLREISVRDQRSALQTFNCAHKNWLVQY